MGSAGRRELRGVASGGKTLLLWPAELPKRLPKRKDRMLPLEGVLPLSIDQRFSSPRSRRESVKHARCSYPCSNVTSTYNRLTFVNRYYLYTKSLDTLRKFPGILSNSDRLGRRDENSVSGKSRPWVLDIFPFREVLPIPSLEHQYMSLMRVHVTRRFYDDGISNTVSALGTLSV